MDRSTSTSRTIAQVRTRKRIGYPHLKGRTQTCLCSTLSRSSQMFELAGFLLVAGERYRLSPHPENLRYMLRCCA